MKRIPNCLRAVACVGVFLTSIGPARALDLLAKAGVMGVYGGLSAEGVPMCSIAPLNLASERAFHIKWFKGQDGYVVHVAKSSWRIPPGTRLTVQLGFDGKLAGTAIAVGNVTELGLSYIEFGISGDFSNKFWLGFRTANRMDFGFPDGNEGGWSTTSMEGANFVVDSFGRCIANFVRPTQPYGSSTQPYGNSPSQPFANPPTQSFPGPSQPVPYKRDNAI